MAVTDNPTEADQPSPPQDQEPLKSTPPESASISTETPLTETMQAITEPLEPLEAVTSETPPAIKEPAETPPEDEAVQPPSKPRKRKGLLLGVVGAALAAIIAGGTTVMASSGDHASIAPPEAAPSTTPTTEKPFSPETDTTVGNIRVARILPTDKTFSVRRENGQVMTVPEIRDPNTVDATTYAESALAIVSSFWSTQNPEDEAKALSELTDSTQVKNWAINYKHDQLQPWFSNFTDGADVTVPIFDRPEAPASFTVNNTADDGITRIVMTGGQIYVQVYGSLHTESDWGAPNSHIFDDHMGFVTQSITIIPNPVTHKVDEINIS